jgi:hypothetical protein
MAPKWRDRLSLFSDSSRVVVPGVYLKKTKNYVTQGRKEHVRRS